jgi:hypothetical protein
MVTQLDSHNVNNQGLSFTIRATKTGHNVRFQVSIESKEAKLSSFLQAHLAVLDGTNQIVSCAVEGTRRDKGVAYEFEISSKYLAESQFNFGNMAEANGRPMPAGDFYWFYLKDFALDATNSHESKLDAYLGTLHVCMTPEDPERELKRWGCVPIVTLSSAMGHRHSYVFLPDAAEVTLQYDEHDILVSWSGKKDHKP